MSQKKKENSVSPKKSASPVLKSTSKPVASVLQPKKPLFQTLTPYLWILGVTLVCYTQSLWFQFSGLDDSFFLVVYAQYFADARNFMRGFKESGVLDYYRPLLFGSLIFDYQFTKTDPFFYHVTNIIYHLIGCWALYKLLIKIKFEPIFALLTTLIYTSHPMWTMAVAWVPGRNDPMITMLTLGSFNYLINFMEKGGFINIFLHWLLFTMALYTKETSALFPFICIGYFFLLTDWKANFQKIMVIGTGWGIIGLIWFAIRAEALELANKNGTRFTSIIYGDSWIKNLPDWPEYIGKFTLPMNLANFPKFSTFSTVAGCILIAIWIVLFVLAKKRNLNVVAFWLLWMLLFFGPSTIFIFADFGRYDYLEHRFHTPAITLVVLMNELIRSFFAVGGREHLKKYFQWGLMGWVVAYIAYTIIHSWNFKDAEAFWKKAIEGAPSSSQVFRGMGKVYYDKGELEKAEVNFMRAVDLNVQEVNTISDLGKAYEGKGDLEGAERCYRRTLKVDSLQPVFVTDMARIYEKKRDLVNAEIWYMKAISRDPNFWQAKFGMGVLAYQKGRPQDAERFWLDVVRINPAYNDTYINLAVLYFYVQQYDKAIQYLDQLKAKGVDVEKLNPGLVNSLKQYRK
ncbi:MAG: tetratricopeptide repeat protein [Cytophagales bacterium]